MGLLIVKCLVDWGSEIEIDNLFPSRFNFCRSLGQR